MNNVLCRVISSASRSLMITEIKNVEGRLTNGAIRVRDPRRLDFK